MQNEYYCVTKQGKWKFFAYNDLDAVRLALFYCWRDDEDFIKVEIDSRSILLCAVDNNNKISTL